MAPDKDQTWDTCRHYSNLHKVPHRNFVQEFYFHFPIKGNSVQGKSLSNFLPHCYSVKITTYHPLT